MDSDSIQDVFRLVDREIWVVTSGGCDGDKITDEEAASSQSPTPLQRGGLVATWVNRTSIDAFHPSVVIGIDSNHFSSKLIDGSSAFGLHLLLPDQTDVAFNFAIGSGQDRDKLSGIASHAEQTGSPILDTCLAWLDCQVYYRFDGGDRVYYFADVVAGKSVGPTGVKPLRESQLIAAGTAQQKADLKDALDSDVIKQRPKLREWREQLGDRPHPKFS